MKLGSKPFATILFIQFSPELSENRVIFECISDVLKLKCIDSFFIR
ncbi:MAG: hypothetical protein QXR44_06345 [Thermoproteota archaeon]